MEDKLSEEEIIERINKIAFYPIITDKKVIISRKDIEAIQGLLDLYNKEKEKNKILELAKIPYLEGEIMAYKENDAVQRKMLNDAFDRGWIHKDKVRERIRELKIIRDENADEIKRNMRFYSIYDSYNLQINELHDLLLEEWLDE